MTNSIHCVTIKKMKNIIFFFLLFVNTLIPQQKKITLTIFHAGSLSKTFKELKLEFEKQNPNINILLEAAGSIESARKITELKRECDIFASSDEFIISNYLIPEYAKWSINFVTTEMVIAFTKRSKLYNKINSDNWDTILLTKDIQYGHSDPNKDPCGYRTLQLWQLAEIYYNKSGLFKRLSENSLKKNIRPKEVDMISLLETNEIDYIFIYKSIAIQYNLLYLTLPEKINLGKKELEYFYKNSVVHIKGKTKNEIIKQIGSPIVYSITIPEDSRNKEMALRFIEFVINEKGREIIEKNGYKVIYPVESKYYDILPDKIKKYAKKIE